MHETATTPEIVGALVILMLVAIATLAATDRMRFPFTVALVIVGISLSSLAGSVPSVFGLFAEIELSADLIFFVFLPTLIFESAIHLDVRQLRQNLVPVLVLAAPGLLLSTAIIGALLAFATPIPLLPALLLGAILSATDPVAVIALFKRMGAPQRLTVLVDGESLFNDATSIVMARVLIGMLAAGVMTTASVLQGAVDFLAVFLGGALIGWALGALTGYLLGKTMASEASQITLTTALAYASFLIAEKGFHVSGVMATVAAGLTFGGQYWMRVSVSVRRYLEHFWEYMAFVATALIFLMVGLRVETADFVGLLPLLIWTIVAMIVSRAVVVYGLLPLVGRLPGQQPVSLGYQTVLYWGGLRGAIAVAIALSLPDDFALKEEFIALVIGAVLFTLLVQGPTMDLLVRTLGLDRPPLVDRFSEAESVLAAKRRALARLPELSATGLFSGPIAERLQRRYEADQRRLVGEIEALRRSEVDPQTARRLEFLRAYARELALLTDLFNKGHLDERPFRHLRAQLADLLDEMRHDGGVPEARLRHASRLGAALQERLPRLLAHGLERFRLTRLATQYQVAWGLHEACAGVLAALAAEGGADPARGELERRYRAWQAEARAELDQVAEQFPEFVAAMQERHAGRLALLAEAEALESRARTGALAAGAADHLLHENESAIAGLRGLAAEKLRVAPAELLRKVPFFAGMSETEAAAIAERLRPRTVAAGEDIIRRGDSGDALYLIARGVVRVLIADDGEERELATLLAGDFFGEMALLHRGRRTATVRAVTPCTVYQLDRSDVEAVASARPAVRSALEAAASERRAALERESREEGPRD